MIADGHFADPEEASLPTMNCCASRAKRMSQA